MGLVVIRQCCVTSILIRFQFSEYQVGPSLGMKAADDLWISRYILWRIAEEFGVVVTFDPKPMEGNWNGAGKSHIDLGL